MQGKREEIRAFIAIEIPCNILDRISDILRVLKRDCPAVKWVRPEAIHLTLKFLGPIDSDMLDMLALELAGIQGSPLSLSLGRPGAFPDLRRPRVVWLGLEGDMEKLAALQQSVEGRCARAGFPLEKRGFSAHLTLGRIRGAGGSSLTKMAELLAEIDSSDIPSFRVDAMHIYESILEPTGAKYRKLKSFALGGDDKGRKE